MAEEPTKFDEQVSVDNKLPRSNIRNYTTSLNVTRNSDSMMQTQQTSRFGRNSPNSTQRKWDSFGNEIFTYEKVKQANELQKKYRIDLNIYDVRSSRRPSFAMSDLAKFTCLNTPVTLKQLKQSERLRL